MLPSDNFMINFRCIYLFWGRGCLSQVIPLLQLALGCAGMIGGFLKIRGLGSNFSSKHWPYHLLKRCLQSEFCRILSFPVLQLAIPVSSYSYISREPQMNHLSAAFFTGPAVASSSIRPETDSSCLSFSFFSFVCLLVVSLVLTVVVQAGFELGVQAVARWGSIGHPQCPALTHHLKSTFTRSMFMHSAKILVDKVIHWMKRWLPSWCRTLSLGVWILRRLDTEDTNLRGPPTLLQGWPLGSVENQLIPNCPAQQFYSWLVLEF